MYYVSILCAFLVPAEVRRGHWIPGTSISDGCGHPCEFWEWKLGPLQEQQMSLTAKHLCSPIFQYFLRTKDYHGLFLIYTFWNFVVFIFKFLSLLSASKYSFISHIFVLVKETFFFLFQVLMTTSLYFTSNFLSDTNKFNSIHILCSSIHLSHKHNQAQHLSVETRSWLDCQT